ncbi:MAG: wax ester/triacylglycerol synthase family O-acyltransferase [bacterium]|nr:wax ester/triacylglycerol synthase family O-acyltransferase [bacterium]
MDQLTGLDNSFLLMETGAALGHVGSYATFDASDLAQGEFYAAFRKTLEERLHLLPPYRRKLAEVPLGLDRPYWVEDEDFDLDFHVRHIAVPAPGDREQQAALVARLHSRPLDRARPLWEVYVIEGLADGRVGFYSKVHHATIDGVSGSQMMEKLLDRDPNGDVVEPPKTPWVADATPSQGEMLMRGAAGAATHPGRMARTLYRTARGVWESNELLASAAQGLGLDRLPLTRSILKRRGAEIDADRIPQAPAPRAPWNLSITPHRRVACFSQPLADYKHVKKAFGTTLNDVVMAVTGGALRRYLESHSSLPEDPLKAMVPVSVRSESEAEVYSNRVASVISELATDEKDPVERLMRIHRAMQAAKRMHAATPATLLQDWTEFAMPALLGQAQRIAARTKILDRLNPPFNVIISNVPGPREPLYLAGAEMKDYFPVSAITDGQGLNVTVISYLDHLDFGLIACRELVPDLHDLESDFDESLAELVRLAGEARN